MWFVLRVGVEVSKIFRLWKVFVLSFARLMGSASLLEAPGYLSTSSKKRYLIGLDARLDGEFDPASTRYMPSNCSSILSLTSGKYFSARVSEISIIGCSLFSEMLRARVSVG